MSNFTFDNVMPYHIVPITTDNTAERYSWCVDIFGPYGRNWKLLNKRTVFCFYNENDAMMFALRWL